MPTLSDTLLDPVLNPIVGANAEVRLRVDGNDPFAVGYSGDSSIIAGHNVTTGTDGTYSMNLPANSSLAPPNSYYEIRWKLKDKTVVGPVSIQMPASGGPYSVHDLLYNPTISLSATAGDWTPVHVGAGTVNATITGHYELLTVNLAYVQIALEVTSAWSSVDVLQLTLPASFTVAPGYPMEQALIGFAEVRSGHGVNNGFGLHNAVVGIAHASDDPASGNQTTPPHVRFLCWPKSTTNITGSTTPSGGSAHTHSIDNTRVGDFWQLAFNGVGTPVTVGTNDTLAVSGVIRLA